MGYRSDVAIKVYGYDEDNAKFKELFYQELDKLKPDVQDIVCDWLEHAHLTCPIFADTGFAFYIADVKWYDDYEHVNFFMTMFRTAEVDLNMNGEYARIGDELADIEYTTFGDECDFRIEFNRTIKI